MPTAGLSALGEVRPVMVAYDQTALNASVAPSDSAYDGVATLAVTTVGGQNYRGSGSLLKDSSSAYDYVLTAAHMVVDDAGRKVTSVTIKWGDGTSASTSSAADIFVHSGWNGNPLSGNDIAVVRIAQISSAAPDRYELFRDRTTSTTRLAQPEVTQVFTKAGYGLPGTGSQGYTNNASLFGTLRTGQNRYDDTYTPTSNSNWSTHTILAYDFDSGRSTNDVIGRFFGIRDLGLGAKEAFSAPGDSGGASFIDGKIAGVTSAIQSLFFGDVRWGANSSFGEIGYDTRVALYADWIDSVTSNATKPAAPTSGGTSGGGALTVGLAAGESVWLAPEAERPAPAATTTGGAAEYVLEFAATQTGNDVAPEPGGVKGSEPVALVASGAAFATADEFFGGVELR